MLRNSLKRAVLALFTVFSLIAPTAYAAEVHIESVFVPNDPFVKEQTYLKQIFAENAWPYTVGKRDVIVAVLDTGVDIHHPDLEANIWQNQGEIAGNGTDDDHNGYVDDVNGWDFVTNTPNPMPKLTDDANPGGMNHGTIVAGIIGAVGNNGVGIAGMNWNVRIMPLRVINGSGYGMTNKIGEAIRYAVQNGASVINLSFTSDTASPTIQSAIWDAYQRGVLVVTAAGNQIFNGGQDLDAKPIYPACTKSPLGGDPIVMTVASTNEYDQKSDFSNYGKNCVQISAPGENVYGTLFSSQKLKDYSDEYGAGWSGTSVSSPMVAGAAALLKALAPQASAHDLIKILRDTSDPIDGLNPTFQKKMGAGRLNVKAAVEKLLNAPPKVFVQSPRIVVARGSGGASTVQVFNEQGLFINAFTPYKSFSSGLNVAVGDLDGDGNDEIVVAPAAAGGPHVRIFSMSGTMIGEFFAYDKKFTGGVSLAIGDVNRDGKAEVITAPGAGGGPQIRIWDITGHELGNFMAFDAKFRGGVSLAAADIDGNGFSSIVAGMMSKGKQVRAFNKDGALVAAYPALTWKGDGVTLSAVDIEEDGKSEVAIGQRTGGSAVKIFSGQGLELRSWTASTNKKYVAGLNMGSATAASGKQRFIPVGIPGRKEVFFFGLDGSLAAQYQVFTSAPVGASQVAIGSMNVEQ
jgi:hypothetical protein